MQSFQRKANTMFKVGDKVRFFDGNGGKNIYTVSKTNECYVYLKERSGGWFPERFELVERPDDVKKGSIRLEIGKKYHKKMDGKYGKVVCCVGFTQAGLPIIEFETGGIYSTESKEWEEYVEPKSGTYTVYFVERTYDSGTVTVFAANKLECYSGVKGYKILATKEVKWTEGDKS